MKYDLKDVMEFEDERGLTLFVTFMTKVHSYLTN